MARARARWGRLAVAVGVGVASLAIAGCAPGRPGALSPSPSSVAPTSTVPPTTTPATVGSPGTPKKPELLGAGQEGTESNVPWSDVGPGWILAEWSQEPNATAQKAPAGTAVLFLVDPLGGRYKLASGSDVPSGSLMSWSGDRSRALFSTPSTRGALIVLDVLDLRDGASTAFSIPGATRLVGFTQPSGSAILAGGMTVPTFEPIQRYSLEGSLEQSYAPDFPGAGSLSGDFLETPDGSELLLPGSHGFELVSNDGEAIREIPMSAAAGSCRAVRWWSPGVALASCFPSGSAVPLLWLVPVGGGLPRRLTTTPPPGSGDEGDIDAWGLPSGTFVQNLVTCGVLNVGELEPGRTTTNPMVIPAAGPGRSVMVLGAVGDRLAILANNPCTGGGTLLWYDAGTGRSTVVLGDSSLGGSVEQAVIFGEEPINL